MKIKRKTQKQGGSYMVSIPKIMCEVLNIKEKDTLCFDLIYPKKIILTKEEK